MRQSHRSLIYCFMAVIVLNAMSCDGFAQRNKSIDIDRNKPIRLTPAAIALHKTCLVIDGHNDLPWTMRKKANSSFDEVDISQSIPQFHTDIPRLRAGGVGAQFWSVYAPTDTIADRRSAHYVMEQIDLVRRMIRRYPETFELALSADDIERIHKQGKIASLIGMEGGHAIENSLGLLRQFHALGARYMTLTHADTLDWADAATDDPKHGGLSPFGEEVVRTMNELGMLIDISHVSPDTMKDAIRVSQAPVIASHSSAYTIAKHVRNIPDDVLKLIKPNRGVIMVNYFSGFVVPGSAEMMSEMFNIRRDLKKKHGDDETAFDKAYAAWKKEHPMQAGTIHDLLDHIDHIASIAGPECVGLGSDYDGVSMLPKQLEDVSSYPLITQGLLDRGYSDDEIRGIMGRNVLRSLREAEQVSASIK
jgi:membrane dipeptidase